MAHWANYKGYGEPDAWCAWAFEAPSEIWDLGYSRSQWYDWVTLMCAVTATEQNFEAWYYDWRSTEELLGHGFERRPDAEFQMIWDKFREVLMMVAEDYDAVSETDSSTNEVTHATRSLRSSPVTEEQLRAENSELWSSPDANRFSEEPSEEPDP